MKPDPRHLIWEAGVRLCLVPTHDTIQQVHLAPDGRLPGTARPTVAGGSGRALGKGTASPAGAAHGVPVFDKRKKGVASPTFCV